MTFSDFQILIKSGSIESRNDPTPKSEVVHERKFSLKISYSTHACLAQLDQHQTILGPGSSPARACTVLGFKQLSGHVCKSAYVATDVYVYDLRKVCKFGLQTCCLLPNFWTFRKSKSEFTHIFYIFQYFINFI